MFLDKWYADVFDGHRVNIFYKAALSFGPAVLGYGGSISSDGRADAAFSAGAIVLPRQVNNTLWWPSTRGDSGDSGVLTWAGVQPLETILWSAGNRLITWNPLVLNGKVTGPGLTPDARGYAERLTINFLPWQLGLRRLKWGRFCGREHSLAWIEWEGRHPLRLCLFDGRTRALHEATLDHVGCNELALHISQRQSLVQEELADGALREMPSLGKRVSPRFLRGVERKWSARGELTSGALAAGSADAAGRARLESHQCPGQRFDEGNVIVEEVVWS